MVLIEQEPNDDYCLFEDWIILTLDTMLAEQEEKVWEEKENLIYYGAEENNIVVFSPTLSDGNLHFYSNPGLIIDIISDLNL